MTQQLKKISLPALGALVTLWIIFSFLQGCTDKCEVYHVYSYYEPEYVTYQEIRSSVKLTDARPLENPGKIYIKGDYLYINEKGEGIHIVNNSHKASPEVTGFIKIPGNYDMAVRGNILYADSYVDLIALDLRNPMDVKVVKRVKNIFPKPEANNQFGIQSDSVNGVITGWQKVEGKEMVTRECEEVRKNIIPGKGGVYYYNAGNQSLNTQFAAESSRGFSNSSPGQGGSMARFTIKDRYLYTIDERSLRTFNINDPQTFHKVNETEVGWAMETIFPYQQKLFLGSRTGMYIYDIAQPGEPKYISTYQHITSCDPVIVSGDFACVTLRNTSPCRGNVNRLDIVDISNIEQPKLYKSYDLQSPHGLGIDGNQLFICEGENGLKSFKVNAPETAPNLRLKAHHAYFHAYDLIPFKNTLITIGDDGLYQFDYGNEKNLTLLSKIPVHKSDDNNENIAN